MSVSEIYKTQELIYEMKVGQIMTSRLITVTPETTMRAVKNLLRDNRISGLPVLAEGVLVGIVSVEDLIVAMEQNALDAPVSQRMTRRVHTIYEDESVVQAVNKFAQTRVGRLPVINRREQLVGILTPDDITRGLLKALQHAYHEEEIRRYRASHLFEDIASDRTSLILRYTIPVRDFDRAGRASSQLKQTLNRLGIKPHIVRRIAIAAYEAEMNIVIHSVSGGEMVVEVAPGSITLVATDEGPGIPDIEKAMQPGFSTAPDWIREMGFGAGMGLNNIQSCTDEMRLESAPDRGTRLEAVVYLPVREGKVAHAGASDR